MIPLSMSTIGESNKIIRIAGKGEVQQHLSQLGFVMGTPVQVISNYGDNLIVAIKDGRIALDKSLANKIFV